MTAMREQSALDSMEAHPKLSLFFWGGGGKKGGKRGRPLNQCLACSLRSHRHLCIYLSISLSIHPSNPLPAVTETVDATGSMTQEFLSWKSRQSATTATRAVNGAGKLP